MKTIFKILLLLIICFQAKAQTPRPAGFPTQKSTGWFEQGYQQSDSATIIAVRDTAWLPRFPGSVVLWRNAGVDTSFWFYSGQRWIKVLKTGDVPTITASNGLTKTVNNITLGGTLTQTTTLDLNGAYDLVISAPFINSINHYFRADGSISFGVGSNPKVGINNFTPTVELDVRGKTLLRNTTSTFEFTGWPTSYAASVSNPVVGVFGLEPSLDLLIDSNSSLLRGGMTFRTLKTLAPKLPSATFGANAGAKIEYNSFITGLDWTSTMEFYLGDRDNNTIHLFALSGPGTHFYGDRKVFTAESKEALMFGTAIRGVNSAAISGLADTSYFVGDAGNKNMYIFNIPNIASDTTNYKPMVYNPTTGVWARSTWPATGGGGGGSGISEVVAGYGLLNVNDSTLRVDTILISTRLWRQKGIDSLSALISLKLNISDTASMLSPYLRKIDTTAMLANYIVGAGFGLTKSGKFLRADTTRVTGLPSYFYVDSLFDTGGSGSSDTTFLKRPLYVRFGTKDTLILNYPLMTPTEDGRIDFAGGYFTLTGSDANNGQDPTTPKQNISALNTFLNTTSIADGSAYAVIKANNEYRAMIDLTSDSVSVGAYGLKYADYVLPPIVSGADVHNSGWTLVGATSFTYSKDIALNIGTNFGYDYPIIVEIDTILEKTQPFTARKYLTAVASQAAVETTVASFYHANLTNPVTIYIRPTSGAPGSNHYRYEVATRRNSVSSSTSLATVNVQRLILRDAGGGYGVFGAATGGGTAAPYVARSVFQGGGTHLVVSQGGVYENNVFLSSIGGLTSGSIAGAFYKDNGTGVYGILRKNIFIDQISVWTSHEGAPTSKLERVQYLDNYVFGDSTFSTVTFGAEFVKREDISGNYVEYVSSVFSSAADTLNVIGNIFKGINNESTTASTGTKIVYKHNVHTFTPPNSGLTRTIIESTQTVDSITFQKNIFYIKSPNDQAEAAIVIARNPNFATPTLTDFRYNIVIIDVPDTRYGKILVADQNSSAGVTAGLKSDSNVFLLVRGAGPMWTLLNPNGGGDPNCFTLANWQSRSGRDANSIFIDLTVLGLGQVFVDPENGNWTLRNTTEGNQVRALLAGPTNPPTYYPSRPSYEQAVYTMLNGDNRSAIASAWQSGGSGGSSSSAGGITQLTGDGTAGPGVGSQVFELTNTAVTPGTYTNVTATVDEDGRITAMSSGSSSSAHLLAGNAYTGTDKFGATNGYTLPIIMSNTNMGFFRSNKEFIIADDTTGINAGANRFTVKSTTTLGGFTNVGTILGASSPVSILNTIEVSANSQRQIGLTIQPVLTNPGAFTNPTYYPVRSVINNANINWNLEIGNTNATGASAQFTATGSTTSISFSSSGTIAVSGANLVYQANTSTTWHQFNVTGGTVRAIIDTSGIYLGGFVRPTARLTVGSNWTKANTGINGIMSSFLATTFTDNSTAGSGTVTHTAVNSYLLPTLATSNTSVTYTNASTMYIANAPAAGTNLTITNPWALYVAAGKSFHAGEFNIGGATDQGAFTLQNTGGLYQSGAVKLDLGSDATGDLYYRDGSGNFVRRAIGSSGDRLEVSGGLPTWVTPLTVAGSVYTPTLTAVANVDAITAPAQWSYIQVGAQVYVWGSADVDPTTTATVTQFRVSLPVTASFADENEAAGNGTFTNSVGNESMSIKAETTNEQAIFTWFTTTTASQRVFFSFGYRTGGS